MIVRRLNKQLEGCKYKYYGADSSKVGEAYLVFGIQLSLYDAEAEYDILDYSDNTSIVVNSKLYEVLDSRIPPGWVFRISENSEVFTIEPKEFTEPIDPNAFDYSKVDFTDPAQKDYWENSGPVFASESTEFWERYHDGCPIAEEIFAKVTKKIKEFHDIKD